MRSRRIVAVLAALALAASPLAASAEGAVPSPSTAGLPWWGWAVLLAAVSFAIGVVAVLGGIGGGVVFVPIVSSFFPFHLDFVRAAGLLIALAGSLAATPFQLRRGYAYVKLMLPAGVVSSVGALVGARVGLTLPTATVELVLGICVLGISVVMLLARNAELPAVEKSDPLAAALGIGGAYHEHSTGARVEWRVKNTPLGLLLTLGVGFLAGMLGLGAGWANVPVFNLVMGAPLKVAAATSTFLISVSNTSAAWIYLNGGAVLPVVVVPSIIGMVAGSRIGVRLASRLHPTAVRYAVVLLLAVAGIRSLWRGLQA